MFIKRCVCIIDLKEYENADMARNVKVIPRDQLTAVVLVTGDQ